MKVLHLRLRLPQPTHPATVAGTATLRAWRSQTSDVAGCRHRRTDTAAPARSRGSPRLPSLTGDDQRESGCLPLLPAPSQRLLRGLAASPENGVSGFENALAGALRDLAA